MVYRLVGVWVCSLLAAPVMAQPTPAERTEAPATDAGLEVATPPVLPAGEDDLGRNKDSMVVDGNAGGLPAGFTAAGAVGGNPDAVVQGSAPSLLPDGAVADGPVPIAGGIDSGLLGELKLELHGFVHAEAQASVSYTGNYDTTFLPRELELEVEARYLDAMAVRFDLNLLTSPAPTRITFQSDLTEEALFDALVEQAYAEWQKWGLTARLGKMTAPFGSEAIDVTDRISLSRSWISQQAAPTLLTGIFANYAATDGVEAFMVAANGWDRTIDGNRSFDGNRSKTLGAGVVHRFGQRADGGWLYSGNLAGMVGPEQRGVNDLRLIVDYSATLAPVDGLEVQAELLYAAEEGEGYNRQRLIDGKHAAQWWAGMLTLIYDATATGVDQLRGLRGGFRLEYLHDHDLFLGTRHRELTTTLLGSTLTLRYALARGLELGVEHRVDFERGDVKHLSIQRNVANPFAWFATQELRLGLLGQF